MILALEPTEKREFQRIPMDVKSSITGDGVFIASIICNIADHGAKIKLLAEPDYLHITDDTEISLNIPKFGELSGRVTWINDDYLGIQFDDSHQVTTHLSQNAA